MRRVLALDLGTKRIGIALASGAVATPYEVLARSGDRSRDHRAVADHVDETGAERVVVGLPRSMDGSIGRAARQVLDEVDELATVVTVPVETWDERLSTVTADRTLQAQGLKAPARRQVVDKVAAAVILQSWVDAHPAALEQP